MMKALIVEDEPMARNQLTRLLRNHFPDIEVVKTTDSVVSTVAYLSTDPPLDVIFMDVELSDGDCFEIFREVSVKPQVIITTAYDSYALKAFETGSIDYLLKPISEEGLERAVRRCRERISQGGGWDVDSLLKALAERGERSYKERLVVTVGTQIVPIQTDQIACFFAEQKSNYLLTFAGERYLVDQSMDALESELDPERFFRVSRGLLVSRTAVQRVNRHASGRLWLDLRPAPPLRTDRLPRPRRRLPPLAGIRPHRAARINVAGAARPIEASLKDSTAMINVAGAARQLKRHSAAAQRGWT